MKRFVSLAMVCAALSAAGCKNEKDESQVIIGVATDLNAPAPLARARVQVWKLGSNGAPLIDAPVVDLTYELSGLPSVPSELPGSVALIAEGEPFVKIVVTGMRGTQELVKREARLKFIAGQTHFLRMGVVSSCAMTSDCPDGLTCVEGVCQTVFVNAKSLPLYETGAESKVTCSSGTQFRNTSSRQPLGSAASQCAPNQYCQEGTCYTIARAETADDWVATFSRAFCGAYVRCGLVPDVASCLAAFGIDSGLLRISKAVQAGRTTYDSAAADACVSELNMFACKLSQSRKLNDACSAVFAGTQPVGGTCGGDYECRDGFCDVGACDSTEQCCTGTCMPRSPVGGPCTSDLHCATGNVCSFGADFTAGVCAAPKAAGSPCESNGECRDGLCANSVCKSPIPDNGACMSSDECDAFVTSYCNPTTRACTPRAKAGQACPVPQSGSEDGAGDTSAVFGDDGCPIFAPCDTGICKQLPRPGEACSESSPCLIGDCEPNPLGEGSNVCRVPRSPDPCAGVGPTPGGADGGVAFDGGGAGTRYVGGTYTGTCQETTPTSGEFQITIAANGTVTGSYTGVQPGTLSGSVMGTTFVATGSSDSGCVWSGTISATTASGQWYCGSLGCTGTWMGTVSSTPSASRADGGVAVAPMGGSGGGADAGTGGAGGTAAALTLAPPTHNFGNTPVGEFSVEEFVITNGTARPYFVLRPALRFEPGTEDFRVGEDGCAGRNLASGTSCSVWVEFHPTSGGAKSVAALPNVEGSTSAQSTLVGTGFVPATRPRDLVFQRAFGPMRRSAGAARDPLHAARIKH